MSLRVRLGTLLLFLLLGSACLVQDGLQGPSGLQRGVAFPTATPRPPAAVIPSEPSGLPLAGLPSVAEVVANVRPAVVSILVQQVDVDFFLRPLPQQGAGSGVIIDQQGHIVTNNHVVQGARQIRVVLVDGRTYQNVEVVGRDPATDLALLRIRDRDLPTARLGDSRRLRIGDWVIAIGNALGLQGGPTVTVGIVSALGRSIRTDVETTLHDLIQTDAAINPGNSGGPLINLQGEVVGLNTAIRAGAEGIGFATSMDTARPVIDDLIRQGRVIQPWIGIGVATISPSLAAELRLDAKEGVLVVQVDARGPARGVLRDGDIILAFEDQPTPTVPDLQRLVRARKVGEEVTLTVRREGRETKVNIRLGEMPRGL